MRYEIEAKFVSTHSFRTSRALNGAIGNQNFVHDAHSIEHILFYRYAPSCSSFNNVCAQAIWNSVSPRLTFTYKRHRECSVCIVCVEVFEIHYEGTVFPSTDRISHARYFQLHILQRERYTIIHFHKEQKLYTTRLKINTLLLSFWITMDPFSKNMSFW